MAQKRNNDILLATQMNFYGRYEMTNKNEAHLISTASSFGFGFEGKKCQLFLHTGYKDSHNYIQYELDGVYQRKLKIKGDTSNTITIETSKDGYHQIWIYKTTEAHTGPIVIEKVKAKNSKALQKEKQPLIEFIGNSITCGAASDAAETPCGMGEYHDQHNGYFAYGPRIARALNVQYLVSAVSGYGVYRNWNSDGPPLPNVYEKLDFQDNNSQLWNFEKAVKPKIVSIALGTNDLSDGDGKTPRSAFDSATFVKQYVDFIKVVKSKYPLAQLVLLSSPMMNGSKRILLQNAILRVKSTIDSIYPNDKPIVVHLFEPMQPTGCGGHPSVEDHATIAQELLPTFKKLMEAK